MVWTGINLCYFNCCIVMKLSLCVVLNNSICFLEFINIEASLFDKNAFTVVNPTPMQSGFCPRK